MNSAFNITKFGLGRLCRPVTSFHRSPSLSILASGNTLSNHFATFTRPLCKDKQREILESVNGQEENLEEWMETWSPRDRSRTVDLETSIRYLESDAYHQTYGKLRVWEQLRRNFARGRIHVDTRKTCIRKDKLTTRNACPICRDEYLVVDYRNLKLLDQFIDDYNGHVYSSKKTGVCQVQQRNIQVAVDKARDLGLLTVDQPFVDYDYSKYNQ